MDYSRKHLNARAEKSSKPARHTDAAQQHIDAALVQRAIEDPKSLTAESASVLQQTHGNRFVSSLRSQQSGLTVQAKLTVTAAGDRHEQEAERVAEQVVSRMAVQRQDMPEEEELMMSRENPGIQRQEEEELMMSRDNLGIQRQEEEELMMSRDNLGIQRQEEEEELMMSRDDLGVQRQEEEEELMMSRDSDPLGNTTVTPEIESQISSARGGGQTLPNNIRTAMEDSMKADFSGVRIHSGGQADTLNRSLQAKAFTTGSDIFFKSGAYDPGSTDGQRLLAHELTHTVQQGAAPTLES